jgi:hypothetical protein
VAGDRIGAAGRLYQIADRALSLANVVFLVAMFVVVSLTG